ncbi:hypothetical protein PoB_005583300 [Plakobranchus ocellatus]|uniref:CCHC-type domain-containing protein n=1 Tax=Plakobranchus ocellatus TaxID=259542 RepID=A0AAV4CD17_9GAST|nr:hypothetical protein PoB_005583300 [Plakobranchus ocellatus]
MGEGNKRYCNSEFKTLASYSQNDSRVQGNCYRCGKPGHRAASCRTRLNVTQHQLVNNYNPMGHKTVPITCYTCGRQGHTSAAVTNKAVRRIQQLANQRVRKEKTVDN